MLRLVNMMLAAFVLVQVCSYAQKAGRVEKDPEPDDFVMMDKEAVLDKESLRKLFVYPDSARKNRIQGTVMVQVLIGKKGAAEKYRIAEAVHPMLDSAAARAVMSAKYSAAIYDAKAIKTWMTVPIIFRVGKVKAEPSFLPAPLPDEGDGYSRPKFDSAVFYSSIRTRGSGAKCSMRVDVLVDTKGRAKEIRNNSQCPPELFDEVKRTINETTFVIGTRNGDPNEDWITISIDFTK